MIAYKLVRQLKDGSITSLFINKTERLPFNKWLIAEDHPTTGYADRPFWHCIADCVAPHLSKRGRVWVEVEIEDYESIQRPASQGGLWFLANRIKFIKIV